MVRPFYIHPGSDLWSAKRSVCLAEGDSVIFGLAVLYPQQMMF